MEQLFACFAHRMRAARRRMIEHTRASTTAGAGAGLSSGVGSAQCAAGDGFVGRTGWREPRAVQDHALGLE